MGKQTIFLFFLLISLSNLFSQKKSISIKKIAPNKYAFILPDSKKRIIVLTYLEQNFSIEKISQNDSFIFINTAKELGLCGMFQFVVYNTNKQKVLFRSKRLRHCCN